MDSNLSLAIGFKGQLALNAQAVPMQEGYLKLGGIVDDTNQANGLSFGVVVSALLFQSGFLLFLCLL